jgi:hypothetical protein
MITADEPIESGAIDVLSIDNRGRGRHAVLRDLPLRADVRPRA